MIKDIVGFWGYPEPEIIKKYKEQGFEFVDLDVDFGYPKTDILPESYCKIVKNIIDNAFYLRDRLHMIVAPIGKDKCDSGWFAAAVLKDSGFRVQTSIYEDLSVKNELKISISNLPLRKKFELITDGIVKCSTIEAGKVPPRFGFWGVPPNDLSILEMFPDDTHVYGWTRCVEAGCPANLELEMFVDAGVPTVFYAQSFCSKTQLAKYLADKYNGLYIDVDDYATKSTIAKIEAFLKLR